MANVILGVSASAACFKAAAFASLLTKEGHHVQTVLTPSATNFVTELQFSCLTGVRSISKEILEHSQDGMEHIRFAREADCMIIMPATANIIGQIANGLAPNLLTALCLAVRPTLPRFLVPSMNPTMFENIAVQNNLSLLKKMEWRVLGPTEGVTACGDSGSGRMLEPQEIFQTIKEFLN